MPEAARGYPNTISTIRGEDYCVVESACGRWRYREKKVDKTPEFSTEPRLLFAMLNMQVSYSFGENVIVY